MIPITPDALDEAWMTPAHLHDITAVHQVPHQPRHHLTHHAQPSWLAREAARLRSELARLTPEPEPPLWFTALRDLIHGIALALGLIVALCLSLSAIDYLCR